MSRHELVTFTEWMKRSGKDITEDVNLYLETRKKGKNSNIIVDVVSDVTDVSPFAMQSKTRTQKLVFARAICCRMFRDFTAMSLKEIGLELGGRDHTTVLHGLEIYEQMYVQSTSFRVMAEECTKRIKIHFLNQELNNLQNTGE